MTYQHDKWRFKSQQYGWLIQKRVGNQWKETQYYRTLDQAIAVFLGQLFHEETTDLHINFTDQAEMTRQLRFMNSRLKYIQEEILEALHDKPTHSRSN